MITRFFCFKKRGGKRGKKHLPKPIFFAKIILDNTLKNQIKMPEKMGIFCFNE